MIGRQAKARPFTTRPLTRDDLGRLATPRRNLATAPTKLRDSHHAIARLAAAGFKPKVISERTGYAINRIYTLLNSPAMSELIAHYRSIVDQAYVESVDAYYDLATKNMVAAERQIADRLDEADSEGETLPLRDLISISRDAADRFGYGKKQTNLNVNVDFAAQLERAIKRSGKQIEAIATVIPLLPDSRAPSPRDVVVSPRAETPPARPPLLRRTAGARP